MSVHTNLVLYSSNNVSIRFTYVFGGYQDYIADHLTVTIIRIVQVSNSFNTYQFQFVLAF